VTKVQFGELIHTGRTAKGYSLRALADRVGLDYTRLARIEHGSRPAPGLAGVRALAQALDLDMLDLLVAAGTPREVMEHLLWSERIQCGQPTADGGAHPSDTSPLLEKNTFPGRVIHRDGARCAITVGRMTLEAFSFAPDDDLLVMLPPEAVLVFVRAPSPETWIAENVFPVRVKKVRRLGQVTNLVLGGDDLEVNSLHNAEQIDRLSIKEAQDLIAAIQSTAIRTRPFVKEAL